MYIYIHIYIHIYIYIFIYIYMIEDIIYVGNIVSVGFIIYQVSSSSRS